MIAEMLIGAEGIDPTTLAAPLPSSFGLISTPVSEALHASVSHPEFLPSPAKAQSPIAVFFSGPPVARKASSNREKRVRRSANSVLAGMQKQISSNVDEFHFHFPKCIFPGTIAGAMEICITYPIDYMKIQLQLDARSTTPR